MSKELDELEALMGQAEESAEEFVAETRGGAGTPAERHWRRAWSTQGVRDQGRVQLITDCLISREPGWRFMGIPGT